MTKFHTFLLRTSLAREIWVSTGTQQFSRFISCPLGSGLSNKEGCMLIYVGKYLMNIKRQGKLMLVHFTQQ